MADKESKKPGWRAWMAEPPASAPSRDVDMTQAAGSSSYSGADMAADAAALAQQSYATMALIYKITEWEAKFAAMRDERDQILCALNQANIALAQSREDLAALKRTNLGQPTTSPAAALNPQQLIYEQTKVGLWQKTKVLEQTLQQTRDQLEAARLENKALKVQNAAEIRVLKDNYASIFRQEPPKAESNCGDDSLMGPPGSVLIAPNRSRLSLSQSAPPPLPKYPLFPEHMTFSASVWNTASFA